jgi:hypothetical protein
MAERFEAWDDRSRVEKVVGKLVALATSIEAQEALGVDGSLREQVDITFVEDPVDYIAYDLAAAIRAADEDEGSSAEVPPLLATLVAEIKLYRALDGKIDEGELVRRTLAHLNEEEE